MLHLKKASAFAFEKAELILILLDGSMLLDADNIRDWTFFVMA